MAEEQVAAEVADDDGWDSMAQEADAELAPEGGQGRPDEDEDGLEMADDDGGHAEDDGGYADDGASEDDVLSGLTEAQQAHFRKLQEIADASARKYASQQGRVAATQRDLEAMRRELAELRDKARGSEPRGPKIDPGGLKALQAFKDNYGDDAAEAIVTLLEEYTAAREQAGAAPGDASRGDGNEFEQRMAEYEQRQAMRQSAMHRLETLHPGWQDEKTDAHFRSWIDEQGPGYARDLLTTDDPGMVRRAYSAWRYEQLAAEIEEAEGGSGGGGGNGRRRSVAGAQSLPRGQRVPGPLDIGALTDDEFADALMREADKELARRKY